MTALTLNADYATSDTNSYVASITEANEVASLLQYIPFVDFKATYWTGANDDAKAMALIFAGKSLNSLSYKGQRYNLSQFMEWPRLNTPQVKWNHTDGVEVIPDEIKWGQVLEASYLLATAQQTAAQRGVLSESVGDHSVEYSATHLNSAAQNVAQPTIELLQRSGLVAFGSNSVYIPRG